MARFDRKLISYQPVKSDFVSLVQRIAIYAG